ncbi:MAG: AAA family ATPase [Ardenticatenales bacterium]|nr:AAA family ATPase [Ardenticatenales bacterium]
MSARSIATPPPAALPRHKDPFRIVLTGGPGGGKTTAADLLRREIGERVVVVPEAATMLFGGGFPRSDQPDARRAVQRAIYEVQRNIEDVQAARYPKRALLCDRGTVDGAAYWPDDSRPGFFEAVHSSLEAELARYDAVLFFETAAVGGQSIEGGNPTRVEDEAYAIVLDARLRELWSQHPRFLFVPHSDSFLGKLSLALGMLQALIAGWNGGPGR